MKLIKNQGREIFIYKEPQLINLRKPARYLVSERIRQRRQDTRLTVNWYQNTKMHSNYVTYINLCTKMFSKMVI